MNRAGLQFDSLPSLIQDQIRVAVDAAYGSGIDYCEECGDGTSIAVREVFQALSTRVVEIMQDYQEGEE